ncbi:HlyD family secretion protein [Xenorhabdus sp. XENO-1]|uniref:HlyD family secretion protein n=1 Tax=Xenorhabdus bovienii TaxID=40576 RepID=UPI0020CA51EA|nr:HlyD family secretion protein [Xenorhabdus bovienii subsp. africana]
MSDLFRKEAISHSENVWIGRHTLNISQETKIPIFLSAATSVILLSCLIWGSYGINVEASGRVIFNPNASSLVSPMDGIAESLDAIDGQQVNAGQGIMVVSHEIKTKSGLISQKERIALTEKKQLLTEKSALLEKEKESALVKIPAAIENKKTELTQLQELLLINQTAFADSQKKYSSFVRHGKKGLISEIMLHESRQEVLRTDENVKNTLINITKTQADIIALEMEMGTVIHKIEEKINDTYREITQIFQELVQLDGTERIEITSPIDGKVAGVDKMPGDSIKHGDVLAVIIPDGAMPVIRLQVGAESAGEIKIGQEVKLRIAAYPWRRYGKFTATVVSVSEAAINRGNNMYFTVIVIPEKRLGLPLKQGMQVEAAILTGKRNLYSWLLRIVD